LKSESYVTLKIYDALGKEVETLVNEFQRGGFHNARYNATSSNLSSGIYYYKLEAGSFTQTKKMIIMK
jgi:flagellar hook assembly protein FlgD